MYDRYRFFKENAGGVGVIDANGRTAWEHARVALDLARAETLLDRAQSDGVASIEWEQDDLPYEHGVFSDDEIRGLFSSGEWTGPFVCTLRIGDEIVASLGGIVVGPRETDDPYCRVVAAELASEMENELREAHSDWLDSMSRSYGPTAPLSLH
jgi:hypothetical protein